MFFNFPFGGGAGGQGHGPEMFFESNEFPHMGMDTNNIDKDADYYKILGVDEKAGDDEIKKAYRKMSMLHHPDKNGNTEESKQMFQELNNAYATLSDSNKRRSYDMMRKGGGGGGGPGFGGMHGHPGGNVFHFGGGVPGGGGGGFPPGIPEELLHMLFGGGLGQQQQQQHGHPGQGPKVVFQTFHNGRPTNINGMNGFMQQQQQPQSHPTTTPPTPNVRVYQVPETIIKTVSLSLEQCYNGCSIPLEIDRQVPDNDIIKIERETIHAQIPKGILQGDTIILTECGHMNEAGMKGDIRIVINVLQHALFKVEHLDLTIEKTITLKSALCGFDFEITHINGRVFKLANKPGNVIKPGNIKTIPGLGLEKNGESGTLKIKFNIEFPDTLTQEQIQTIQGGL
jgi:DnaJ-class molecular chaperone